MRMSAMRRGLTFALVALVTTLAGVAIAPAARAVRGPTFALTVDRHVVHGGESFTATAVGRAECAWILQWDGDRRASKAARMVATFTAPQVTRPTKVPLDGTCFHDAARNRAGEDRGATTSRRSGSAQRLLVTVPTKWTHTVVITVLPAGTTVSPPASAGSGAGDAGGLPGTGGPALEPLVAGIIAVLAGAATALTSRGRSRSLALRRPKALRAP